MKELSTGIRNTAQERMMGGEDNLIERVADLSRQMGPRDVADTDDPIFRNYLITQSYWQLSESMLDLLGRRDLVWPAFGAWASAQAGRHMRMESPRLARLAPSSVKARVIDMLGRGNQRVFLDIAPPFHRFIDFARSHHDGDLSACGAGGAQDIARRIREELELDPRSIDEHPDGQRLMIMALTQYFLALHEDDPDSRAERIYVANCCVGLQEQTRIDCMLDSLLDVDAANDIAPWVSLPVALAWWATGPLRWGIKLFATTGIGALEAAGRSVRRAEREARIWEACLMEERFSQVVGTRLFMNFQLNDQLLDIDDDVPWSSTDAPFPPALSEFDTTCADFRAYLDEVLRWDDSPDSTTGSGALDWTDLGERMDFILDLFRTRQQDLSLAVNPLDSIDTSRTST